MAKMFYTLEETAEALGVSEDDVKQMVEDGKLQQFRDRDKVMFKRDQVDQMAPGGGGGPAAGPAGGGGAAEDEEEDNEITLMPDNEDTDASKTDSINLSGDSDENASAGGGGDEPGGLEIDLDDDDEPALEPSGGQADSGATAGAAAGSRSGAGADESEDSEKQNSGTGVSVFGADETESTDAMEETQVGADTFGEDEINFDGGGGSGSGLLDLTRESDDTSLGAVELLEDVDTEETGQQQDEGEETNEETMPAQTGVFEGELGAAESAGAPIAAGAGIGAAAYAVEESDPAGDGFGGGMLLGMFATLIAAVLIVVTGMQGMVIPLTGFLSKNANAPLMYGAGGFAGLCIVLSLVGWMIGRSRG